MKHWIFNLLFLLVIIRIIFHAWFLPGSLNGGDTWYSTLLYYQQNELHLWAWLPTSGNGLGAFNAFFNWISLYYQVPIAFLEGIFHLNLSWIERIGFVYPYLIVGIISSIYLSKLFNRTSSLLFLFSLIFIFNTYSLMLISGQVELALAYVLSAWIVYLFLNIVNKRPNRQTYLFACLLLSFQTTIDPRITYITLLAIFLYFVLYFILTFRNDYKFFHRIIKITFKIFIIPGIIDFLINSYWLLPTIINHQSPLTQLGSAYTETASVQYFSFAKLENSISLLHPNWPENIFGLTHFMQPEFIILPILAFISLLFIKSVNRQEKIYILYFSLLTLIGSFLAKGANAPLGILYMWMFNHIPGFIMFRDPTKWYVLVALGFSVLIPFTIFKIYELLKTWENFNIKKYLVRLNLNNSFFNLYNLFLFLVIFYLLVLIMPALFGQLTGMLKSTPVPIDYVNLEKFLSNKNRFSRTLWIPVTQRFGYYSNTHPEISGESFYNIYDPTKVVSELKSNSAQIQLQEAGVAYVIVPYDSEGEIFLNDRKYDSNLYEKTIDQLNKIKWLKAIPGFGSVKVFQVSNFKNHFWSPDKMSVSYKYVSPVEYKVNISNASHGDKLVFVEGYDSNWELVDSNNHIIHSGVYDHRYNSFLIPDNGTYTVYYSPQIWVDRGVIISLISLGISLIILLYLTFKSKLKTLFKFRLS